MKLKESAKLALAEIQLAALEQGVALLEEHDRCSVTFRFEEGPQAYSIHWEHDDETDRFACTCGQADCRHQAALLLSLADGEAEKLLEERFRDGSAPQGSSRPSLIVGAPDSQTIAEAVRSLVHLCCEQGIEAPDAQRDEALASLLVSLKGYDLPDLKRAVASLRRAMLNKSPDPTLALASLCRLESHADALAATPRPLRRQQPGGLSADAERREEVHLFEVARATQRTPFGDRREVSYFLDLDERELYREIGVSAPGALPTAMSTGPFPKRLLGNLAALEPGPCPRRIRLLQYASVGVASTADLDRLVSCCEREISVLYREFRDANVSEPECPDYLVLFAPTQTLFESTGVVLADGTRALLPLARSSAPDICQALDVTARLGKLEAVIGQLQLGPGFLCLLPLSALVDLGHRRSLRRFT